MGQADGLLELLVDPPVDQRPGRQEAVPGPHLAAGSVCLAVIALFRWSRCT
jgi:hypothetical protein